MLKYRLIYHQILTNMKSGCTSKSLILNIKLFKLNFCLFFTGQRKNDKKWSWVFYPKNLQKSQRNISVICI